MRRHDSRHRCWPIRFAIWRPGHSRFPPGQVDAHTRTRPVAAQHRLAADGLELGEFTDPRTPRPPLKPGSLGGSAWKRHGQFQQWEGQKRPAAGASSPAGMAQTPCPWWFGRPLVAHSQVGRLCMGSVILLEMNTALLGVDRDCSSTAGAAVLTSPFTVPFH